MTTDKEALLQRRFDRERKARKEAEAVLDRKSRELYYSNTNLAQLAEHLESLVEERTEELRIAVDEALQASRAKSEFLSNMSHELRTPLNAIIGFSDLLLTDPIDKLTEMQKDGVDEIRKAGWHLLTLINEILDLAKIESGKLEIVCSDIDVAPVVMESLSLVTPLAQKAEIEVHLECDPNTSYMVNTDATRLKQVMINVMSNAIKYNKQGGNIFLRQGEEISGTYLRITVEDTGVGIAEEDLDGVFEAFNRVGQDQSAIEGTGIGLPLSRKMMQEMGGDIDFSSIKGEGTKFWIDVPLALDKGDEAT